MIPHQSLFTSIPEIFTITFLKSLDQILVFSHDLVSVNDTHALMVPLPMDGHIRPMKLWLVRTICIGGGLRDLGGDK
jgi:hypothetical protein